MADDIPLAVRNFCYDRDNHRCRWCGTTNSWFHLHHIVYRSTGGLHVPENLITLCEKHHSLMHSNKALYQPILQELIQDPRPITGIQLMRWKR